MDFKTILVEVGRDAGCRDRLRAAARLASAFGAHLAGVTATGVPLGHLRGSDDDGPRHAALARDKLRAEAAAYGDLMKDMVAEMGLAISFAHEAVEDEAPRAFVTRGMLADLSLLAQRPPWDGVPPVVPDVPEQVILSAGRPVMVLPQAMRALHGGHMAIAWDGGREAARAVADALPLLRRARQVTILTSEDGHTHGMPGTPHAGLEGYLRRHGIDAASRSLPTDRAPRKAILSCLETLAPDMLVAGCYGHARLRELVIGGTTRTLLQRCEVPLFMSH